jgi:hypothetical protein
VRTETTPAGSLADRIDNAIANLCPCGADPRPGSAYCSDDRVPTHRSTDTISDIDGTAMRWRPDLVTETDDTQRVLLQEFRRGPYRAQVFDNACTDGVHCRLDDGHRYVGALNGERVDRAEDRLEDDDDQRRLCSGEPVEVDLLGCRRRHIGVTMTGPALCAIP